MSWSWIKFAHTVVVQAFAPKMNKGFKERKLYEQLATSPF